MVAFGSVSHTVGLIETHNNIVVVRPSNDQNRSYPGALARDADECGGVNERARSPVVAPRRCPALSTYHRSSYIYLFHE